MFWFRIFQFEKFFAVRRKRYSIVLLHGRIIIYSNIIYHCHQKLKKGRRPTARCLRSLDFCCIFIPTCSKSHGFPTTLTNVCAFVVVVCSTVKQESYHESCAQMGHIKHHKATCCESPTTLRVLFRKAASFFFISSTAGLTSG